MERDFPAKDKDYAPSDEDALLQVKVPAGMHKIRVESTGKDWVRVASFSFSDHASGVEAFTRGNKEFVIGWLVNRSTDATSGKLALPALSPGKYTVNWYDTRTGSTTSTSQLTVAKGGLSIDVASMGKDAAFVVTKERGSEAKGKKSPSVANKQKPAETPSAAPGNSAK